MRPKEFNFKKTESDASEAEPYEESDVIDNSIPFEPIPIYFRSDQLVSYVSGKHFMFESDEKSSVEYGGKIRDVGRIFEFYDENQIVFIKQVGKYSDNNFEAKVMLEHNWGQIPVQFLKGIPKITKSGTMWISPFFYAVDLLDLVLLNETNLQASINSCVYPYRIIEGNECDFEYSDRDGNKILCDDGWIHDILLDSKFKCPSCGGSGLKSNMGALGVMIIKQPTSLEQQIGTSRLRDPVMFVSPQTEPLDFLKKKIESDEMKARKILHLQDSSSNVQPSQDQNSPALKTALDLKGLYAFLKTISDQIFDLFTCMHQAAAMYLFGVENYKDVLPTISYPVSYDFKTEGDYLNEIAAATNSNLPPHVIHTIIYRYISALFFNDQKTAAVFLLIVATDRLLVFSADAIEMKKKDGLTQDWEIILHDSGLSLIDQLATENKDFFNDEKNPLEKRKQQLIERAKLLAVTIKTEKTAELQAESAAHASAIMQGTEPQQEGDNIGKIPLALQQLALAKERAKNAGDTELVEQIQETMKQLLTKMNKPPAEVQDVLN
jgi:hypothetical protein